MACVGAAQREVDVESMRKQKAQDLVGKGLYAVTADTVEILDDGDGGNNVEISTQRCTCKANSHGVMCVCLYVAQMIGALPSPSVSASADTEDTLPTADTEGNENLPTQDCKTLIEELHHWCQGPSYVDSSDLKPILQQAHRVAFGSFKKKRRQQKKIAVLHPYRKKIVAAKKLIKQTHKNPTQKNGHIPNGTVKCESFKRKSGCVQSRTKYHKRMKLPSNTKSVSK